VGSPLARSSPPLVDERLQAWRTFDPVGLTTGLEQPKPLGELRQGEAATFASLGEWLELLETPPVSQDLSEQWPSPFW